MQSKPAQIFLDRGAKLRPATHTIQIFDPQNELAISRTAALLRAPESGGVTRVQITGGRRRETAAINFRAQTADFRLPDEFFNPKSPF